MAHIFSGVLGGIFDILFWDLRPIFLFFLLLLLLYFLLFS